MHHSRTRLAALAATGLATVALGLVAALPANAATPSASASSTTSTSCDQKAWEAKVQGDPTALKAGVHSGDYLWHDKDGFHLRVTHEKGDRRVYTGVITASSPMRYTPVKLEKGDIVTLSSDRKTLSFSFVNYGKIDGANFHTDCGTSLTLSRLHVGDQDLPAKNVYLGAHEAHPAHVPFTIHRQS